MPQRKQPRTLSDMSVEAYVNIYYNVCNRWNLDLYNAIQRCRRHYRYVKWRVMTEIEQTEQTISKLAPLIQSKICPKLASIFANNITFHFQRNECVKRHRIFYEESHDELCVAMFRSVLTPSLYEFEPDMFSYIFTWFLVIRNLDSVPGLRILSMNQTGDIIRSLSLSRRIIKVSALVATSLHQLKELQVFRFPGYCTDEVVRELGLNCPKLTEVSFINSQGVTNASYPHLLSLRKLQFLDITGTRINNFHYGQLLSRLPNIADVRFVNKEDDLIRLIAPNTIDTITHVTNIVADTNMQIKKFPKTQKFILKTANVDLSALTAWTELHTLEILLGDYPKINLNAVLTGIGHQLTVLILKRITRLKLLDIITLCTSLRNLDLHSCLILPVRAATPLNPQLPHFRNLIYLKIETSVQDRTDFSFIRYYLNLERIELLGIDIFTEEFMKEAIILGTLANLKECYISETDKGVLTLNVLEQLIHHCPNLKIFGHTKKLDLLNTENVLRLKRELSEQNFDIDIIS